MINVLYYHGLKCGIDVMKMMFNCVLLIGGGRKRRGFNILKSNPENSHNGSVGYLGCQMFPISLTLFVRTE